MSCWCLNYAIWQWLALFQTIHLKQGYIIIPHSIGIWIKIEMDIFYGFISDFLNAFDIFKYVLKVNMIWNGCKPNLTFLTPHHYQHQIIFPDPGQKRPYNKLSPKKLSKRGELVVTSNENHWIILLFQWFWFDVTS